MNTQEAGKLLTIIQTTYRNHFKDFEVEMLALQHSIWAKLFENISMEEAYTALMAWMAKEKFPPTPAELIHLVSKNKRPEIFVSAEKAWEAVSEAVRRFGWNNQERAFETFSGPIRRAINSIGGWQKVCQTELGREWDFLRKNFMESFEEFGREDKDQTLLPTTVLNRLAEMNNQGKLGEPE
jgi:hypothetical protein